MPTTKKTETHRVLREISSVITEFTRDRQLDTCGLSSLEQRGLKCETALRQGRDHHFYAGERFL